MPVVNAWPARSARASRSSASGNCSSNLRIRRVRMQLQDDERAAHRGEQPRPAMPSEAPAGDAARTTTNATSAEQARRRAAASRRVIFDARLLDQRLERLVSCARVRSSAVERAERAQRLLLLRAASTLQPTPWRAASASGGVARCRAPAAPAGPRRPSRRRRCRAKKTTNDDGRDDHRASSSRHASPPTCCTCSNMSIGSGKPAVASASEHFGRMPVARNAPDDPAVGRRCPSSRTRRSPAW